MKFVTKDPYGRDVSLSLNVWEHIQARHPEFTGWEPFRVTIEDPNIIGKSNSHDSREIFYKINAHPNYPNLYVCVVAEYCNLSGVMKTGHFSKDVTKINTGGYTYVKR